MGTRKIPFASVRIGSTRYSVAFDDLGDGNTMDGQSYYGLRKSHPRSITLDERLEGTNLATTFIHEILHCFWSESFLENVKEIKEEIIVTQFAQMMTCFWMDNPKAAAWWAGLCKVPGARA